MYPKVSKERTISIFRSSLDLQYRSAEKEQSPEKADVSVVK
jgi:hypothetical protein